jgi:hypothetical protein
VNIENAPSETAVQARKHEPEIPAFISISYVFMASAAVACLMLYMNGGTGPRIHPVAAAAAALFFVGVSVFAAKKN